MAGPDFVKYARDLTNEGDAELQVEILNSLYALALYQPWFTLNVDVKGSNIPSRLIPGHIWGDEGSFGPQPGVDVMIIGKMPGRDEIKEGRNLAGQSGTVFRAVLDKIGCPVNDYALWYITNLLKFTHPAPHLGSAIAKSWIKDCKPLLLMELQLIKPSYILCLGNEASKELLGMQGAIKNSIGKVFDYEIPLPDGTKHVAKLMTCIHPAAVARDNSQQPQLEATLRLFIKLTKSENVGGEESDLQHHVARTEAEAIYWLDTMIAETENGGAVAIDCEWQGQQPKEQGSWLRTIQVSHKPKFALCLVIRECGSGAPALVNCPSVRGFLDKLFNRPGIRAVGHFHRADLPWLLEYGLDLRKNFEVPPDPLTGWELTKSEGGFDTGSAAHSVCETDDFKLEVQASRIGVPRYDLLLQKWKKEYCARQKIKQDDLPGYGDVPDEIIFPYANYDVDSTRRLFDYYNGVSDQSGLLDCDEYGNNSRIPFWITMRASPACFEMEQTGILVDTKRAEALIDTYRLTMARKVEELKKLIQWDTFNINSSFDCKELLFGPQYRRQIDKKTGAPRRNSPPTAKLCGLRPIKSTSKSTKESWEQLEKSGKAVLFSPSTDKETLGILFHQPKDETVDKTVGILRDIKFIGQLLKTTLKPPVQENGQDKLDENGEREFEKGLLSYVCDDGRIHTTVYQTLETGRYSTARPCVQNLSARREADYARILAAQYLYPMRSLFVAPKGYALVEADYVGAELAGMAWMSGDPTMIEHVRRAQLAEDDPDYYDIHSAVAVAAFKLNCAPTKSGLKSIGKLHLRVAAKNVVFGYAYGRGAEAIARQAKEEGVTISVAEAQALINGLVRQYPLLPMYFAACRQRTHDEMFTINCFGRVRRFYTATDRRNSGDQERQSMNFGIQSLVADAVSRALDHMYTIRELRNLNYKILLQIHDAILLEVPVGEIDVVYDSLLPECMTDRVNIRPCDLDGMPINDNVYHLGIDKKVSVKWGCKLTAEDAKEWGVPDRFVKGKK